MKKTLPPRVLQVLALFLEGRSEKEIARIIGITKNTVHHYAKMLSEHYDVASRGELMAKTMMPRPDVAELIAGAIKEIYDR